MFGTVKVRNFRTRVPYNANCDASRQLGRISYHSSVLLAGGIELNPGPEPGERPTAGQAAGSSSPPATLTAYHANVLSLKKQLGSLRAVAPALTQYDIVSFSETWLNDTVATLAALPVQLEHPFCQCVSRAQLLPRSFSFVCNEHP